MKGFGSEFLRLGAGIAAAVFFIFVFDAPALAQNECGSGATVTCTSSGNPYPDGITYSTTDQTVNIGAGVVVSSTNGVALSGSGAQTITVTGTGVTISSSASGHTAVNISGASGAATIDTSKAAVSVSAGGGANGVQAVSTGGAVSVTTGDVTMGSGALDGYGVVGYAIAGSVNIDTAAGTVKTAADGGVAIYALSFSAPVTITTAGVTTSGNNIPAGDAVYGVFAWSGGVDAAGAITIDTSAGAVTMNGTTTSHAINAENISSVGGGPIKVTTADVSTKAANADGIFAQSKATAAAGAIIVDSSAGLIKTEGAGAVGIFANNTAVVGGGAVTVVAGDISTKGDGAYGVYASSTGTVSVTTGDVTTAGVATHGIQAVSSTGEVDVTGTGGKITTTGKNSRGINIDKISGAVTVHSGAIATSGDNATGIHIYDGTLSGTGTGGAITVTANSVVTTGQTTKGTSNHYEVGNSADAIDIFNIGAGAAGKITIDTSVGTAPDTVGIVSASGRKARGIVAVSGMLKDGGPSLPDIAVGGGAIDIKTGTVTTTGDFGTAVSAQNYGTGADGSITINALGAISASGANLFNLPSPENEGNYQPNGISAFAWGGGDVTITTKDVSSVGEVASAISAQSGNGDLNTGIGKVTINTTGGTVTAKGAGSHGISVGSSSGAVSITSGIIKTEGDTGYGIFAGNTGPNSDMTIDTRAGKITTAGKASEGIGANLGNWALQQANAGKLQILAGSIDVQGANSDAITAGTYNGVADIEIYGALTTGAAGGDGVVLHAGGSTTATVKVINTGSIVTTAANADGINIWSGSANTSTITIDGMVKAQGAGAYGILLNGRNDQVTVDAEGTVYGTAAAIRLQETNGNAKVTNAGTLQGTGGTAVEFLGTTTATFDNDGTVTGDVLLGGGADTAIIGTNSVINNNVDGRAGSDKLQLTGTGTATISAAKFLNFETGEQIGSGTWTLTGSNAAFVSTFGVNAGRLAVDGTLSNTAFTVADGAILGGIGDVGALTINAGGKLAPGNSPGTLHATSAVFDASAIFDIEINATIADKLEVSGTATINSAAKVAVTAEAGTYTDGSRYQILTAGSRTGTFDPTVVEDSAFLDFTLDQSIDNEVWLTATLVANLTEVAETPNQIAAAGGIDEQGPGMPLFDAILPLDADSARRAFDLSSGEIHATEKGVLLKDSRFVREAILQRLDDAFTPGGAGADPTGPMISSWAQASGSGGAGEGDGNAAAYGRSIGGFVAGIDLGEPGAWRFGVAAGYQRAGLSVPDRLSTATADGYHFAAYGSLERGPFALRFGGALTNGTVDTVRNAAFGGFDETLSAHYRARTSQVFAEASYRGTLGSMAFEPFADVVHVAVDTDGFTETGGAAALSAGPDHRAMTLASFGARFAAPLPMAGARLTALVAWQHRFGDMTPTADLAFDGGTPFTVAGVPRKRDSLRIEAGFDWDIGPRATLSVGYSGNIASGMSDHGARATLRFRF